MFTGFTPETVDFLWGIRLNNNRDWFMAHKKDYVQYLYEPMKALGKELFQPFMDRTGDLLKVSRIYRDARMHHPQPYKESLWICIRKDVEWWAENPCLYFEIRPEGASYGFVLWRPSTAAMEAFRREITRAPEEFLQEFIQCTPGSATALGLMHDTEHQVQLVIDREVYEAEFFCAHPCICTSTVKMKTRDVLDIFLAHTGHTVTVVDLPEYPS